MIEKKTKKRFVYKSKHFISHYSEIQKPHVIFKYYFQFWQLSASVSSACQPLILFNPILNSKIEIIENKNDWNKKPDVNKLVLFYTPEVN